MATIRWEASEQKVGSIDEMDRLLDELHTRGEPILAAVELKPSGDSLTIGLGREASVLNFVSGSGNPPYFTSRGSAERDDVVWFSFMGDLSEFPMHQTVPVSAARQAMRHFW